jgi:hypothetical protein
MGINDDLYCLPKPIQEIVRVAYAECLATLAETAMMFLEMSQVCIS